MAKLPSFQFYPGDWIQDTAPLSLSSKGAWVDILCTLWRSPTRGEMTLPIIGWARVIRSTADQAGACISELTNFGICDSVTLPNGDVTVMSRRQKREEKEREMNANRQSRYRSNAEVTVKSRKSNVPSSSSSSFSTSSSKTKTIPLPLSRDDVAIPEDLLPWKEQILEWLQYKREKKKPYKPTGLKHLWTNIREISATKRADTFVYSMGKNWDGLYERKEGGFNASKIVGAAAPNDKELEKYS